MPGIAETLGEPICNPVTGETICKPLMAAVGNAVYDATGVRLRRLPLRDARVLAALRSGGVAI